MPETLSNDQLKLMDAYWRAANYLSVGQIYLYDNPLLKKRLGKEHIKRERPRWPMIVLRSPKGWTCPAEIDGKRTEDYWRSHQVPMGEMHSNPAHIKILEQWMKSYKPEELFDTNGPLQAELSQLSPLSAQSQLCQCRDCREAAGAAVA